MELDEETFARKKMGKRLNGGKEKGFDLLDKTAHETIPDSRKKFVSATTKPIKTIFLFAHEYNIYKQKIIPKFKKTENVAGG